MKVDKLAFGMIVIVNDKNIIIPTNGLTKENIIEDIKKIIILDLIFINANIIKFMQAKVIASLPIAVVQIFRVGKNITKSHKNFIGLLIFFVKVFIFDARAKVPILPIKAKRNVMEKILK